MVGKKYEQRDKKKKRRKRGDAGEREANILKNIYIYIEERVEATTVFRYQGCRIKGLFVNKNTNENNHGIGKQEGTVVDARRGRQ